MTWFVIVSSRCTYYHWFIFSQGILNEVWKNKLIFVETPDANETSIALENYRRVSAMLNMEHNSANIITGMRQRARRRSIVRCSR